MSATDYTNFFEAKLLIVTGMSGAGRSTASNALEDKGWYVIDNLPPQMFKMLADMVVEKNLPKQKMAIGADLRGKTFSDDLLLALENLRSAGVEFKILFLDCGDDVLVRRFEQARRPHPLQGKGRILDGIVAERKFVKAIREKADLVIDTSTKNVHQLATVVVENFSTPESQMLNVNVVSFGFKYGIPTDANYIADVRFVPNPYWVASLRPFTGLDAVVSDYVLKQEGVEGFLDSYVKTLEPVFAGYVRENKYYATIAIGCTGGKHRSVAISEKIAAYFLENISNINVNVSHRDLGRE